MVRRLLFVLLIGALLAISACTLDTVQQVREISLDATQTAIPLVTPSGAPSALPTFDSAGQPTPALRSNPSATTCGRLRVSVGTDPAATLRLRQQPNNASTVILLIPNGSLVTPVAGAQNVTADGYTWVNIQYTDPNGVIATGWAAQDAMKNTITLVPGGC